MDAWTSPPYDFRLPCALASVILSRQHEPDCPMKLLVFAHVPPPHHGQSYMVRLMLDGFGGDKPRQAKGGSTPAASLGGECYHVNARVSKELEDIGDFRVSKLFLLFGYCFKAIWYRFRYGVK